MKAIKMKKNNILIVTQNFFPEVFGINDIVEDLVNKGFKVDVLTGLPNYPQGKFYDGYGIFKRGEKYYKGARLYRCTVFPRLRNSKLGICLNYATFPFFATFKLIRLTFKKYDKVFVYEPSPIFQCIPALIIAWFKRCERIIYVLDIWPDSVYSVVNIKNKFFRKLLKKYSASTYRKFDKLLVTSKGFIPQLNEHGVVNKKIIYLPQWAAPNNTAIINNELREQFRDTFNLVFTGNVGIPQNLGILVDAAVMLKDYKDIRWIIVGDGDYLPAFKKLVSTNNLEDIFVFMGRKPYNDIPMYYNIAHGLLATLKDIELFSKIIPAKIQAYMTSGKPILCSINGEGASIVEEAECGLISPAGNAKALADNILKLYNIPQEKRAIIGQNGIEYSRKHFDSDVLLSRLASILSKF